MMVSLPPWTVICASITSSRAVPAGASMAIDVANAVFDDAATKVGAVVAGVLFTATVTPAEVAALPALSVAVAVSV